MFYDGELWCTKYLDNDLRYIYINGGGLVPYIVWNEFLRQGKGCLLFSTGRGAWWLCKIAGGK